MKKLATATAIILVLSLVLTSLTAFAAPATTDYADIIDAVADAIKGDTVEIICSGDYIYEFESIVIPEGVTLKLSAAAEGATFDALAFDGAGKLEIDTANLTVTEIVLIGGELDATVNGDVGNLNVTGDAKVTVNGNVKPTARNIDLNTEEIVWFGTEAGLYAADSSEVTVNGDVFGTDITVTVGGYPDSYITISGSIGVSADNNAVINITGNVAGGTLTVNFAEDFILPDELGFEIMAGDGVSANLIGGKLTVGGNVVGGKVIADYPAFGGVGLYAGTSSVIKIAGDVFGGDSISEDGEGGAGFVLAPAMNDGPIISSYDGGDEVEPELPKGDIYVAGTVTNGNCANGKDGAVFIPEGFFFGKIGDGVAAEMTDDEFLNIYAMSFFVLMNAGMNANLEISFSDYMDKLSAMLDDVLAIMVEYLGEEIEYSSDELLAALEEATEDAKTEMKGKVIARINLFTEKYLADLSVEDDVNCLVTVWALSKDGQMFSPSYMKETGRKTVYYINRIAACENGSLTTDVSAARAGETVTVTPVAADGYKVSKVFLGENEIIPENGKYSFVVEDGGAILLSAEFVTETSGGGTSGGTTGGGTTGGNTTPSNPNTADGMTAVWVTLLAISATALLFMRKKVNR